MAKVASQIAWRVNPKDVIQLDGVSVVDGRYLCTKRGSKVRLISVVRVLMPDASEDPRTDFSASMKSALQQQRMRGLFEGLRRASVPFFYTVLMGTKGEEADPPLFEYDLAVGTWVDGKVGESEKLADAAEQRASVLSATLSVALPNSTLSRLLRYDLAAFFDSLLLPGSPALPQCASSETGGSLCTFDQRSPAVGQTGEVPEFYVPNKSESTNSGITLGPVRSPGGLLHDFGLQVEDLKRHVTIVGMTGSGKSTTGLTIVKQMAAKGMPMMIFDWHNEYGPAIRSEGGTVLAPGKDDFSVNPVEPSPETEASEHVAIVSDIFSDIYHFTHPQAYMFRNALQKRMNETDRNEVPTLLSLVRTIEAYPLRSAYDNETKVALLRRLVPLTQGQAGKALGGLGKVTMSELLLAPVCVELGQLRDAQTRAILTEVMLKMMYEQKVKRKSALDHLTVIEEARNVVPARRPEDPPSVGEKMVSEMRKFGEAMVFIAQFPTQIASEVVKNSGTKIVHRISWPDDVSLLGDSLGLSAKQREYMTRLEVGEAIVGVGRIQKPVLTQVEARTLIAQAGT